MVTEEPIIQDTEWQQFDGFLALHFCSMLILFAVEANWIMQSANLFAFWIAVLISRAYRRL